MREANATETERINETLKFVEIVESVNPSATVELQHRIRWRSTMIKPNELASELGVSVSTVGAYAREGLIPFTTTPKGHRRYDLKAVRAALAEIGSPTPLTPGEGPVLTGGPAEPFERAQGWRPGISAAMPAEDSSPPATDALRIPSVGVPGTRRFLTGSPVSA
jgi:hypothetical protein